MGLTKIEGNVQTMATTTIKAILKNVLLLFIIIATSQMLFTNDVEAGCCKKLRNKAKRAYEKGKGKAKETVEKVVKAPVDVAQAAVNVGEAGVKVLKGDKEGAKKALNRSKKNLKQGLKRVGSVTETVGKTTIDLTVTGPIKLHVELVDEVLHNNGKLGREYKRVYKRTSREIKKSSISVGAALEVAAQPENVGKIAFIYTATTIAGPLGASFANVIYDKIILKKNMSNEDMFKSFAIGAAAGYAAQGIQGLAEGKRIIDSTRFAGYLSKSASAITRNVTTDLGNVTLNGESYSSRDFFKSLAKGAATVEFGNNIIPNVIESTIESGMDSLAEQSVENDLNFKKIDFKEVEHSLYDGFASGITREAVHSILDAALIDSMPENWKRVDQQVFDAVKEVFYQALLGIEAYQENQQRMEVIKALFEMNEEEREELLLHMKRVDEGMKNKIAMKLYGKKYEELNATEIMDSRFKKEYTMRLALNGAKLKRNCPTFRNLVERYNNGRSIALAAEILGPSASKHSLKVIEGGFKVATQAVGRHAALRVLGTIISPIPIMLLYSESVGQGSDGLKVGSTRIFPPSSYDREGWELYERASRGDRAALHEYLNRDSSENTRYRNPGKTDVPQKAKDVLEHIDKKGVPPKGYKGGRKFENKEGKLPKGGNYREYDVNPKVKGKSRGTERIVKDVDTGKSWYTPDHYETFHPMN